MKNKTITLYSIVTIMSLVARNGSRWLFLKCKGASNIRHGAVHPHTLLFTFMFRHVLSYVRYIVYIIYIYTYTYTYIYIYVCLNNYMIYNISSQGWIIDTQTHTDCFPIPKWWNWASELRKNCPLLLQHLGLCSSRPRQIFWRRSWAVPAVGTCPPGSA